LNKKQLEELFCQHHPLIVRAVSAQKPNISGVTAEDVEQEVCIRLLKVLESDRNIENLPSYIYRMTSNVIIDLARKHQKHLSEMNIPEEKDEDFRSDPLMDKVEPGQNVAEDETIQLVMQAIESLPKARRIAVKMRLQGFSIKEMCELTGWSFYKAENLSKRSMIALKDKLQEIGIEYETD